MLTQAQKDLLHLLKQHAPADEEEARILKYALTYVELEPVFYDARTIPAHVTASPVIFDAGTGRLVMQLDDSVALWRLPGSHDSGAHEPAATAVRLAREVTGSDDVQLARPVQIFDVDMPDIPPSDGQRAHRHIEARFLVPAGERSVHLSSQTPRRRWVGLDEAATLLGPRNRRLIVRLRGLPAIV